MAEQKGKSAGAFRTISEVSDKLNVPQHVLRFWETKFTQVKPLKRAGGRRYYRPEDIVLLERLRDLLYAEGYTIRGVQKLLREKGAKGLVSEADPESTVADPVPVSEPSPAPVEPDGQTLLFPVKGAGDASPRLREQDRALIREVLNELREIRAAV